VARRQGNKWSSGVETVDVRGHEQDAVDVQVQVATGAARLQRSAPNDDRRSFMSEARERVARRELVASGYGACRRGASPSNLARRTLRRKAAIRPADRRSRWWRRIGAIPSPMALAGFTRAGRVCLDGSYRGGRTAVAAGRDRRPMPRSEGLILPRGVRPGSRPCGSPEMEIIAPPAH